MTVTRSPTRTTIRVSEGNCTSRGFPVATSTGCDRACRSRTASSPAKSRSTARQVCATEAVTVPGPHGLGATSVQPAQAVTMRSSPLKNRADAPGASR